MQLALLAGLHMLQYHTGRALVRGPLQQSRNRCHCHRAAPDSLPLSNVHVTGLSADESFVHFNLATDLNDGTVLHGEPDALKHEPAGPLSDSERTANFVAADPVLRIGNQPERANPFVVPDGAIFEDCPDAESELLFGLTALASPQLSGGHKTHLDGAATGTRNLPIREPNFLHKRERALIVREVFNGFLEGLGKGNLAAHAVKLSHLGM